MDVYFLLFVINVVLANVDAAVAYLTAPRFIAALNNDSEGQERGIRRLRSLLPLLVALYITLACQAFAQRHAGYLAGLTLLMVGDILLQLYIGRNRSGTLDGEE